MRRFAGVEVVGRRMWSIEDCWLDLSTLVGQQRIVLAFLVCWLKSLASCCSLTFDPETAGSVTAECAE